MPTPPKPFTVLTTEKKSHRTKAELKQRQQAEEALSTGVALKERPEVKNNPIAHKEFKRINELLKKIQKNDAIYEGIINRYCLLYAECYEFEEKRKRIFEQICNFEEKSSEMDTTDYYKIQVQMQKTLIDIDKQIQAKRKMLFDIEKENIMTIASALRNIPKKVEQGENPLLKALGKT